MVRWLAPNGGGVVTPLMVATTGLMRAKTRSCMAPSDRLSLLKTRKPTGTLPTSKRRTKGLTVPGGMYARARSTWATTSDMAPAMSTSERNRISMTAAL